MITDDQLNEMLNQFGSIWPSMNATMSHDQKMGYVVQLATALNENGLDNGNSVREGFRKARSEGGQYLPSVPEFVRWCKVQKTTQNLYVAPPSYSLTDEERDRFSAMSKNLLESMK
jgi:hypothetical protein